MKKIILSLSIIAAAAAIVIGATTSFFSDTETSTGNTFTAGALDLQVDFEGYYNKPVDNNPNAGFWTLKDLDKEKFFDFDDVKPGDSGEGTISLHVFDNNAWGCVNIIPTLNDDVSSTEPELDAIGETANTDSIYDGELAQNMQFKIWADVCSQGPTGELITTPGDNIFQPSCDLLLTHGTGPIVPTTYALADAQHPNVFTGQLGPLIGSNNYYLGVEWEILDAVGNIIQTDKYQADISFYTEQHRNNPNFVCQNVAPTSNTLRLENETEVVGGPWTVLDNDQIFADLTWTGNGPTFNYTLNALGLTPSTDYSLIYYADGWPGNNPGAFIGLHTTDPGGNIVGQGGNPNLGIDLPTSPDGNLAIGAKIWLVRRSDYNGGLLSTGPMTAWNPSQYLFEGNVYINYDDTDSPL